MSYTSEVLLDSPDVYLRLDETGAGPFVDVVAAHNVTPNGTIVTNATLLKTTGDAAAKFDYTTGTLQHGTSSYTVSQQPLTVEFWVNPIALTGSTTNLSSFTVTCGLTGGWASEIVDTTGVYRLTYEGVAFYNFTTSQVAVIGTTHHVVYVLQSGNTIDLYVNGVFQQTIATGALGATTNKLCIGRADTFAKGFPRAIIDEVAVYKSALAPYRISAHYAAGVSGQVLSACGAGV